jgi:hypothetical protein
MVYVWRSVPNLDAAKQLYVCFLLPSLETLHNTTTKKSFAYSQMLPYMMWNEMME